MTPVRQLLLGLASGSAFYSGLVPALGLGEITLHSALNQPLDAEIKLLEVGDLSASDLLVRLASAEVYSRSGVDRLYFLNDLRFTPLLRGGNSVIRVVSSQPVREPYLNFIVEVARPNGQLLREYTVLLDPPGSSAYRAVATVPAVAAAPVRTTREPTATTYAPPSVMPAAEQGARYQVKSGDSLWVIAARLRTAGSEASQPALMQAIHALNPQAFSNGDINRLQAGADLLLPDIASAEANSASAAVTAAPVVGEQPLAPPEQPLDPQVEMLAQVQRRVDQELANQAAENLQLQQSLADLQAQMQQLQVQMSDKDQQLATLQAQLATGLAPVAAPQASTVVDSDIEAVSAAPSAPAVEPTRNWIGAGFAALVVLLAGLLGLLGWTKRRAVQPPQPHQAAAAAVVIEPEPFVTPVQREAVARIAEVPMVAPERSASPTDALEGANIYIAYGRFSEAAATLRKALDVQPQRSDIRFRLLEVLAQLGDAQAFTREESILRNAGFTAARIEQLKARHPGLLADSPRDSLDDAVLQLDESQAQPTAEAGKDDDFQLNLDDLSLDADWDLVSPFSPGMRSKAAPAVAQDLPEVFDIASNSDVRSPFADSMLVEETSSEGWLQDELDEAFISQPHAAESVLLSDLDQLAGSRDNLAKLNLALAYIEQGSLESACNILNEVINDGDDEQKQEARELLAKIA
ncbi:FimV/HubP family polar landmark protein [Pseudomonas sp. UBA2684]|uniref:FimV/HubP family polar landmark protein n=1 Tax=Pseudomonas sp. UBA2684 TaxID=1947311 RepID=UPI0025FF181A|nr:FimV/HubP family polar landmark protein [Pseudomonas sp. UBA2684]|tara:strand:- start:2636 stop:4714 length:2079 start_codon:yes stop_codon:yes gene_type:complete